MNWLTKVMKALGRGLAELSPSCREAARLQSDAMDRPLSLRKRIGLNLHILLCKWCRRYGKHIRFLHDAAHEHPDQLATPAHARLTEDARVRMKQRLRAGEEQRRV